MRVSAVVIKATERKNVTDQRPSIHFSQRGEFWRPLDFGAPDLGAPFWGNYPIATPDQAAAGPRLSSFLMFLLRNNFFTIKVRNQNKAQRGNPRTK